MSYFKIVLTLLLPSFLLSNEVLSLPVLYDPFKKTKKLIVKRDALDINITIFNTKKRDKNTTSKPMFTFNGIFNNKIIIDGKIYAEGDKVNGYEVVKIFKRYVLLKNEKKRFILPFEDENITTIYKKEVR